MTENLKIWEKVCETDPASTKKMTHGAKLTAIDAYSQIKAATAQFGPVGEGWGWEIEETSYPPNDTVVVMIKMWHGSPSNFYHAVGQKDLYNRKGGEIKGADEDAFKKALTDAITKGLSYLGFNADVFLGLFDDNKYVDKMTAKANPHKGDVMKAKAAFKKFCDEVAACDDTDQLDAFLASSEKLVARFGEVIPEYMAGGGDVPSYEDRINQQRIAISNAEIEREQ